MHYMTLMVVSDNHIAVVFVQNHTASVRDATNAVISPTYTHLVFFLFFLFQIIYGDFL